MNLAIALFTVIAVGCGIAVIATKRDGIIWQTLFLGMMLCSLGILLWIAETGKPMLETDGSGEASVFSYALMGLGAAIFLISFCILAVEEFKDFLGKNQE